MAIDKLITTPVVDDDHFFNEKLKDEISGNDYKEVVDQHPRNWILRAAGNRQKTGQKKQMTLADALKGFNEEHENRAPSKLRARRLRSTPHTDSGEMIGSGRRVGGKMGRGFSKEIGKNQNQLPAPGGLQHKQTIPARGQPFSQYGPPNQIPPGHGAIIGGPFGNIPPMGPPIGGPMGGPISGPTAPMGGYRMPPEAPWLHRTKAFAPRPRPGMNIRVVNV